MRRINMLRAPVLEGFWQAPTVVLDGDPAISRPLSAALIYTVGTTKELSPLTRHEHFAGSPFTGNLDCWRARSENGDRTSVGKQ
jgi:hypothetical protein